MVTLGLVVAEFNSSITERMEESAREAAAERGADIVETLRVPGAYDTPLAADRLARREDVEAVAVLGAIITGETDHDQVIARTATRKLTDVSLERDKPVALGITGPGMTADQARERAHYGARAVDGALDMVGDL